MREIRDNIKASAVRFNLSLGPVMPGFIPRVEVDRFHKTQQ